jgi:hypothetical protein
MVVHGGDKRPEPPFSLIVISGGWPSELIAELLLDLPLLGAYFPAKFHRYFKLRGKFTPWFVPSDAKHSSFPEGTGLLVLGSSALINGILLGLGLTRQVIASVHFWLHSSTVCGLRKNWVTAKEVLNRHGLRVVSFLDCNNGGAMDACCMFGFGGNVVPDVLLRSMMGLPWTLRHFLDGGTMGFFPIEARVPRSSIPTTEAPPRKVLWHLDAVLGEGLFPCSRPL